ncbi:MAG: ThuA domain-containing protein [Planctomycetaceae bacterium]
MVSCLAAAVAAAADPWVVYQGTAGPGVGKHIVLMSGDEEYRSEETLPALGQILARHHGFRCTVLFAINPETGVIDPNYGRNIPGIQALASADLVILCLRFRDLPDDQMQCFVDYVNSGKPIIGLRTATHAFNVKDGQAKFHSWSFNSKDWDGGFGRQVLGETWISHHGKHKSQATRGVFAPGQEHHPILRGIAPGEIFGPTDVYGVRLPLPGDSQPIVLGQVVNGMHPDDPPVAGKQNDPMMPIAWTRTFTGEAGKAARVFTTTMGAATDLPSVGVRRMLINSVYWALGLEDQITGKLPIDFVGEFKPTPYGFDGFQTGRRPEQFVVEGLCP